MTAKLQCFQCTHRRLRAESAEEEFLEPAAQPELPRSACCAPEAASDHRLLPGRMLAPSPPCRFSQMLGKIPSNCVADSLRVLDERDD